MKKGLYDGHETKTRSHIDTSLNKGMMKAAGAASGGSAQPRHGQRIPPKVPSTANERKSGGGGLDGVIGGNTGFKHAVRMLDGLKKGEPHCG